MAARRGTERIARFAGPAPATPDEVRPGKITSGRLELLQSQGCRERILLSSTIQQPAILYPVTPDRKRRRAAQTRRQAAPRRRQTQARPCPARQRPRRQAPGRRSCAARRRRYGGRSHRRARACGSRRPHSPRGTATPAPRNAAAARSTGPPPARLRRHTGSCWGPQVAGAQVMAQPLDCRRSCCNKRSAHASMEGALHGGTS